MDQFAHYAEWLNACARAALARTARTARTALHARPSFPPSRMRPSRRAPQIQTHHTVQITTDARPCIHACTHRYECLKEACAIPEALEVLPAQREQTSASLSPCAREATCATVWVPACMEGAERVSERARSWMQFLQRHPVAANNRKGVGGSTFLHQLAFWGIEDMGVRLYPPFQVLALLRSAYIS